MVDFSDLDQTNFGSEPSANPHKTIVQAEAQKFTPVRACQETTVSALEKIAIDPAEAARLYGKETGSCSCCGRELTDPVSIEAGIGPICAGKWGL